MTTYETLPSLLDDDTSAAAIDHELKSIGRLVASGQTPLVFFGAGYMGRVASLADMPTSYKGGSLFITRHSAMGW
jgi:hypothetical protein